ncbi:amino acid ABC transporter permease [Prochlorothrix hollandica]|uniref:Amino acid ABC transporter permease n=1 Tax=Prochlorothrix hollandica PCC 9006 = CALU 1027 TaxID=317619 RepID=A0A0M2PS13_PROHO|nr:amino acid ABC transporter permease [Prochlorothrix hollandica]KKI98924.1 amino acid ABC transporter permease [Prochlorothrix hollandica PCC 9006 = CALU 1027]
MTSVSTTPSRPPLLQRENPLVWCRTNLFSNWFSSLLTLIVGWILVQSGRGFWLWATAEAQWAVIPANLPLLMGGRFPSDQSWRLWLVLALISALAGLSWGWLSRRSPRLLTLPVLSGLAIAALITVLTPTSWLYRGVMLGLLILVIAGAWGGYLWDRLLPQVSLNRVLPVAWSAAFFVGLWLIRGGFGLAVVSTGDWSGLLLTVFLALVSILLCFPLGVLLALGRQSELPAIRWLSTFHIEVIRGVPLISILFMGQVMIPLFLPEGMRPDRVLRAIVGLTLFSAAYMAENIRGGLQAIPRGQVEAANALGLSTPLTVGLVVLPQALKVSIPSIVGQFISLFQDTTLLSIVGLLELLGLSRSVMANPEFVGRSAEVYCFIGLLYWAFCYAMSLGSRRLEQVLNTEHR